MTIQLGQIAAHGQPYLGITLVQNGEGFDHIKATTAMDITRNATPRVDEQQVDVFRVRLFLPLPAVGELDSKWCVEDLAGDDVAQEESR